MSSRLIHVTVVSAFTVTRSGAKVKLSIVTSVSAAPAREGVKKAAATMVTSATRRMARRLSVPMTLQARSTLQRLIDDGETLLALLERNRSNAEHRAQLVVGDLQRAGRRRGSRRGLREGG